MKCFYLAILLHAMTLALGLYAGEKDEQLVASSPNLSHLASALVASENTTVAALFDVGNLNFHAAPDPTPLLLNMHRRNQGQLQGPSTSLSVLSFNVALLEAKAFGLITLIQSPYVEERRPHLPALLLRRGYDVLLLQEVWSADVARFQAAAERFGYHSFLGPRGKYDDGLLVLVKKTTFPDVTNARVTATNYSSQFLIEYLPGFWVKRGFLRVSLRHKDIGVVHLYDTHLQSFRGHWQERMNQARELGNNIRDVASDNDIVIVGGDMNAGPYYRDDTWLTPNGKAEGDWWKNAVSYPVLLHYADLTDLVIMGLPSEHADADVTLGNRVVNNPALATTHPGAEPDWCNNTPSIIFTATDCNSMNFQQYAGIEYPARQDHLFARDPMRRIRVTASGLAFTDKILFGPKVRIEPSDHYAAYARLEIQNTESH